jgi:hypothetical protein
LQWTSQLARRHGGVHAFYGGNGLPVRSADLRYSRRHPREEHGKFHSPSGGCAPSAEATEQDFTAEFILDWRILD